MMNQDDDLIFADDNAEIFCPETFSSVPDANQNWNVLIVDDEKEVHSITEVILDDICFLGRKINLTNAYSGWEALEILKIRDDIAVIFLDVVMETDDAGLRVAEFVRKDLQNNSTRIVLRTGQPGYAPEKEIIVNYDINDYKEKSELTAQKLFTTTISALRAYEEIGRRLAAETELKKNQEELENTVAVRTADLIRTQETLHHRVAELETAQADISQLQGLLPICSYCRKIRNDNDYWDHLETYISRHSGARFSHSICPECYETIIEPELQEMQNEMVKAGLELPDSVHG